MLSRTMSRFLSLAAIATLLGIPRAADAVGDNASMRVPPRNIHACESVRAAFASDPNTTVTLIKVFEKGDMLLLPGMPTTPAPQVATSDVCLVKLIVGPGNPGPAGAPSTSAGIGIEVWLPSPTNWNGRIRVFGEGAWDGDPRISSTSDMLGPAGYLGDSPSTWAMRDGYVGAIHDGGHVGTLGQLDGSFAMNPDGSINTTLMRDLSSRSIHEAGVKTKLLAAAFYHKAPEYAYYQGCSSAGRMAYKAAQAFPDDFDGIYAFGPSKNQTQFFPTLLYPHIVQLRDLGGESLTAAQLNLASSAAVSACDAQVNGRHEGFISDPEACTYDVTTDPAVLCVSDGGTNATASCLTLPQAKAINKMWYGPTADGSAPPPQVDNGQRVFRSPTQRWWGIVRGDPLPPPSPIFIWPDQTALNMQDVSYAGPSFINASGPSLSRWRQFDYPGFVNMLDRGLALNDILFADIDTNNPDLRPFRDHGGKMLTLQGLASPNVAPSDTKNYYARTSALLGGFENTQEFHRLYLVPGMANCGGVGSVKGLPGVSPPPNPPLPTQDQIFDALVEWVEHGKAPTSIVLSNSNGSIRRPVCMYPQSLVYLGGDVNSANSYACVQR
jgi:Tannase and feruloyl esterase